MLTGKLFSKTRATFLVETFEAWFAWTGVCSLLPAPHFVSYQFTLSNNISDIPTVAAFQMRATISRISVVVSTLAVFLDFFT
jgi:hypothetical protein